MRPVFFFCGTFPLELLFFFFEDVVALLEGKKSLPKKVSKLEGISGKKINSFYMFYNSNCRNC